MLKIQPKGKFSYWFDLVQPVVKECDFIGKLQLLAKEQPRVCIVGSRKMTNYGREVLEQIIPLLVSKNITIVSGGAFGVDIYTHQLVRRYQGSGIVVLPSSLKQIYPKANQAIISYFKEHGLLLSENRVLKPNKYHFIARNRIMAAISNVVIVIEAAQKSGALYTAQFALDAGKNVATIPGNIFAPLSEGCNRLIAQGAGLILKPSDVLDFI